MDCSWNFMCCYTWLFRNINISQKQCSHGDFTSSCCIKFPPRFCSKIQRLLTSNCSSNILLLHISQRWNKGPLVHSNLQGIRAYWSCMSTSSWGTKNLEMILDIEQLNQSLSASTLRKMERQESSLNVQRTQLKLLVSNL